MLREWSLGADGGGGLFYLSAKAWFSIFGASAISFRLYSAAGFAAAFAVLWAALRPYYSRQVLLVAMGGVWFIGSGLITHICEGRFYGLFLFGAVLCFCITLRNAAGSGKPSVGGFLVSFLANGVLVTSHFLGLAYSLTLLASLIVLDVKRKRLRLHLYLPPVLAWCLLFSERTAIRSAINVDSPHSWIARPALHKLLGSYHAFDAQINRLLLLLTVAVVVLGWRNGRVLVGAMRSRFHLHPELYVVTFALALIPPAIFVESWMGTPLFLDRYLLPIIIVPIVFAAETLRLLDLTLSLHSAAVLRMLGLPVAKRIATAGFVTALLLWIFVHGPRAIQQRQDYTQALVQSLPVGSTVVLPDSLAYTEVIARQYDSPIHFVYLLDWERSIAPGAPRADVSAFHLLSSWRHAGYHADSIQEQTSFLQSHPKFYVLETRFTDEDPDPNATDTVLASIARSPSETVRSYPSIPLPGIEDRMWLICHSACPPQPQR